MTTGNPTDSAPKAGPACSPNELKRFKVTCGIVLTLSALVLAMAMAFGNFPRSFVDRLNLFTGPMMVLNLGVCGYALWRFRRACNAWRKEMMNNPDSAA